jgi:ubiquitin-protein ligase
MYDGIGLVRGDTGTPYRGGFYLIYFDIPKTYPFDPPKCHHISFSGRRQIIFCGNELLDCLSTIWTPSMNITTVLSTIKIQILSSFPLNNEPDYKPDPIDIENYDKFVKYLNLRSNVVDIYTGTKVLLPDDATDFIRSIIRTEVLRNIKLYEELLEDLKILDGEYIVCTTYTNSSCLCNYQQLNWDFKNLVRQFTSKS